MSDQRIRMVEEQLRGRGIRDERVLAAMAEVPREEFVGTGEQAQAYGDYPLPIGAGRTVSQPYIVAAMIQQLAPEPHNRVLEVGTGTGYQAAILGLLADEVWTVERHPPLVEKAQAILARLGYANVRVIEGDGTLGLAERAPYDKILVAAAAPQIPTSLVDQLADGGTLVLPVGTRTEQQVHVVRKVQGKLSVAKHDLCRFVPLVGAEGWKD